MILQKKLSLAFLLVAAHASFNSIKPTTLEQDPDLYFQEHIPNLEDRINHVFKIFLTDPSVKFSLCWFFERLIFVINQNKNSDELKKRIIGIKGTDKTKFIEDFIKTLLDLKDCTRPLQDGALIGLKLRSYISLLPKEAKAIFETINTSDLRRMIQFRIKLNIDKNAAY